MSGLKKILERCKCGVFLTVNEHKDYYQTTAERIAELRDNDEEISDEAASLMLSADKIVELQFYPDTPIGFYKVISHDFDDAVSKALKCLGIEE